jgi:GT2 family glycosyltransferase
MCPDSVTTMKTFCPVSVIIPTKNRIQDLLITLDAIAGNTVLPHEVIIVDQTEADQGQTIQDFFDRRHFCNRLVYRHRPDISGRLFACDLGVTESSQSWLFFLDDDVSVAQDFFERLSAIIQPDSGVDAVCAVDMSEENLPLWRVLLRVIFWRGPFSDPMTFVSKFHDKIDRPVKSRLFKGGYMCCKRHVYLEIGFDKNTHGNGDVDFSYRASKKYNLVLDPRLRVFHRGGLIPSFNAEQAEFRRTSSRIYFFRKNVEKNIPNYIAFSWLMFGTFVGTLARSVSRKSIEPLKGFIRGLLGA